MKKRSMVFIFISLLVVIFSLLSLYAAYFPLEKGPPVWRVLSDEHY